MRVAPGRQIEAQDVVKGMILTNGHRVFRAAKVTPMNLSGVTVRTADSVTIEPTYLNVQIITTRGNLVNLRITDKLVPLVPIPA